MAQSVPTIRIDVLAGPVRTAHGYLVALRRTAVIDQLDAVGGRESAELGVVGDELVQAGDDIEAVLDGVAMMLRHWGGILPPWGAVPMSRAVGSSGSASARVATMGAA